MVWALLAHSRPDMAPGFVPVFVMFVMLFVLAAVAIKILICCRIFAKAGYCWALGLLMLVPVADIIMAFVLAFGDWPVQKELRCSNSNGDNGNKSRLPSNRQLPVPDTEDTTNGNEFLYRVSTAT